MDCTPHDNVTSLLIVIFETCPGVAWECGLWTLWSTCEKAMLSCGFRGPCKITPHSHVASAASKKCWNFSYHFQNLQSLHQNVLCYHLLDLQTLWNFCKKTLLLCGLLSHKNVHVNRVYLPALFRGFKTM